MTEAQIEVIRALADNSMSVAETARAMGKKPATIHGHINNIMSGTGKDPLNFHELNELLKIAERQQGKKKIFVCTCKICGAKFEAPDHHYKLCSDECRAKAKGNSDSKRDKAKAKYMREYRLHMKALDRLYETEEKPKPSMSLAEVSRMAREKGMSYGQYMTFLRECSG